MKKRTNKSKSARAWKGILSESKQGSCFRMDCPRDMFELKYSSFPRGYIHVGFNDLRLSHPHKQKAKDMASLADYFLIIFLLLITSGAKPSDSARVITIINNCKFTIWPAIIPGESFDGGGFALKRRAAAVFTAPVGWSGRIWARTGCNFDKNGNGSCLTGACESALKCVASGKPPATLAEFTLASPDFYDVSLVDGFNLPLVVTPVNGQGNCTASGCYSDLSIKCPSELAVKAGGKTVGCRSACDVFGSDEYCCKGVFGNPTTCQPTAYSKLFKSACPTAYSYAYDDPSSIFTCTGADYILTFCSSRQKQPVCTYHDNRLVCSGSTGFKPPSTKWLASILFYALMASWATSQGVFFFNIF